MFETVINFVSQNYVPVITAYVIGGILYAILKWFIQLVRLRSDILRTDFSEYQSVHYKEPEKEIVKRKGRLSYKYFADASYPPQVSENKGLLTMWAIFWPINLVYTMFADVARGIWDWTYRSFGGMLQRATNAILPD